MSKKLTAILLACIMLFSVLFTGCAEQESNNLNKDNTDNGNNEQVSTGIGENNDVSGKIDEVISDVLSKYQPSSKRVEELASKNELELADIKNYRDFLLYVNQDNETLDVIRNELAPGRSEYLPLDFLFGIESNIVSFTTIYYNLADVNGTNKVYAEYSYYRDRFTFNNNLNMSVFYVKPGAAESACDFFTKTYYAINSLTDPVDGQLIFNIINYDASILKYNTLFSINEDVIQSKFTMVTLNDEFLLRYNSDGNLDCVYLFINNIFVEVDFIDNSTFAGNIDTINSKLLTTLFNDKTAALTSKVLETVLNEAKTID